MRKNTISGLLIGMSVLSVSSLAQADLTANVGVTSNYVFRGESYSDNGFAIQGGLDFTHTKSGLYAGIWGSNVEDSGPQHDKGFEVDYYGGWNFKANENVTFDVGIIAYRYYDTDTFTDSDEIFVGAALYGFSATYYDGSPDTGPDYGYVDLKYTLALKDDFNVHVHFGNNNSDNSYYDWNDISLGISKEIVGIDMSLTWSSIDYNDSTRDDDNNLFITLTKSFDL